MLSLLLLSMLSLLLLFLFLLLSLFLFLLLKYTLGSSSGSVGRGNGSRRAQGRARRGGAREGRRMERGV
eukprot:1651973-Rhodomonas_salina.1